ncbi:hypothetical protein GE09DRAFT_147067 [Coniochaeta sp. 2T2.1]|nr:hypothetical protein GE09DRAFT_147067 [Coniochaeta sp. 2T2.1]
MSYSGGSGGTLTLPSPTHVHHIDVTASARTLRQPMSRSPSRFGLVRTASGSTAEGSPSTTPKSSPTPAASTSPRIFPTSTQEQPALNYFSTPGLGHQAPSLSTPQTTAFTPLRTGVKLSVRSSRPRPQTARPLTRTRASPKSPLKRVFGASPDSGNLAPLPSIAPPSQSQEDNNFSTTAATTKFQDFASTFSPVSRRNLEKPSRHSLHLDVSGASTAMSKFLDIKNENVALASASPLKRSDALMNMDQSSLGSPVAKRRSLHGIASFGSDFNVFDHAPAAPTSQPSFDIHEDAMNHDYPVISAGPSLFRDQVPPPTPTVTRRASSLRKTTLQQRHGEGRLSFGRRQGEKLLSNMANEAASTPAAPRSRPRLSLDQFADPRSSPFTADHPLPNPSSHAVGNHQVGTVPHPLRRTITQSSSGSSIPDDSPTHYAITHAKVTDKARIPLNWAKSVPVGSQRSSEVSTPAYKNAKPDPEAFNSTGIVSKVGLKAHRAALVTDSSSTPMPDTPCKKQQYPANTFPPHSSYLSGRRSSRPAVAASPSTPFSSSWANPPAFPVTFGKGNLFNARNAHSRRSSLLSIDGDDSQDIPPTPTKNLFVKPSNAPTRSTTTPSGSPSTTRYLTAPGPSPGDGSDPPVSPVDHLGHFRSPTPTTPQGSASIVPLDASRLSISQSHGSHSSTASMPSPARPPATPTTQGRMSLSFIGRGERRFSITSTHDDTETDHDVLSRRFTKAEPIGAGEFSHVFKVTKSTYPPYAPVFATTPSRQSSPRASERVFVVKKLCAPITGPRDRQRRYHEVNVLKALSQCNHVVRYFDSWEEHHQLYIQTEYCEEGSLEDFLGDVGKTGRLDDFRIWKIMLELCYGIREIHDHNFIHLDLKPANVFITFEGKLKIGDFGLAAQWPVDKNIDGEGDRIYIAPEILHGGYDKPADIFSLGMMMIEAAANIVLPDNGEVWRHLRDGNLSDIPSLTSMAAGAVVRDVTGTPIGQDSAVSPPAADCIPFQFSANTMTHDAGNLFNPRSRAELRSPPQFMVEPSDPSSLDSIVAWMLFAHPEDRPTAQQLIDSEPLRWIAMRRHAGATVYEGNWGPEEGPWMNFVTQASVDTEMTDA